MNWRTIAATALRFGLSAALLMLVMAQTDLESALLRLASADAGWLAAAFLALALQIVAISWRWGAIMASLHAPLGLPRALSVTLAGLFIGQALPTSVGSDAWRIWRVHRLGHAVGTAVHGVLIDRAAALAGLVVVVGATLPALLDRLPDAAWRGGVFAGMAATVLLLGSALTLDRIAARLPDWTWLRAAGRFAAALRRLLVHPRRALPLVGVSIAVHVGAGATVWLIARSLGVGASLVDCLVLMPPILLIAGLPMSVAGWGMREGAMVALFGAAGIPADGALPISILFGLLLLAVSLPGGALLLVRPDLRRRPDAGISPGA
ncbi:MAG TPA: lysylphosphatidylglycerol synthase transmembrane domain-containing protein [Arenibaculum sp.]|nr:lysylphosphatidylglycerol synthase transmembrane domain-containing protein [Arenibaculum sp.]